MKRRQFIVNTSFGLGAAWLARNSILSALADAQLPRKYAASDTVTLGKTGIQTSRLAMGTGTVGYAKHSNQTALGVAGLSGLLLNGYDHGLRFFDAADSYGSHPHVAAALKQLPRDKVTVMTKSPSRTPHARLRGRSCRRQARRRRRVARLRGCTPAVPASRPGRRWR